MKDEAIVLTAALQGFHHLAQMPQTNSLAFTNKSVKPTTNFTTKNSTFATVAPLRPFHTWCALNADSAVIRHKVD